MVLLEAEMAYRPPRAKLEDKPLQDLPLEDQPLEVNESKRLLYQSSRS